MTATTSNQASPAMDAFWENVRTILYALALAMVIRFTIAQPFRIPSGSMQPTLEVGDYIVVTKWTYGYGRYSFAPLEGLLPHGRLFGNADNAPKRGDVIVFRPEPEPDRDFIKRLIGMPGDRIQVTDGVLYINGQPVQREDLGALDFEEPDGAISQIDTIRETLPNGVSYTTFNKFDDGELDNTREFVVPEGHYFMMGDDRDNSADSRTGVVGYVPYDNLVGPAQFVIASFNGSTSIFQPWTLMTGFRADRFLKAVE
jgi:signal peptidase I